MPRSLSLTSAQINALTTGNDTILFNNQSRDLVLYGGTNLTGSISVLEINNIAGNCLLLRYNSDVNKYSAFNIASTGQLNVVVNGSTQIFNIVNHNGSTTGLSLNGTLVTAIASDINKLAGVTAGTASASKAIILDSSSNITGINSLSCSSLSVNGVSITTNGGGSGGSPTAPLTLTYTSTSANVVNAVLNLQSTYSGTTSSGIGTSMLLQQQNDSGTLVSGTTIQSILTTVTNAAENSKTILKIKKAGSDYTTLYTASNGTIIYNNSASVLQLIRTPFSADGGSTTGTTGNTELTFSGYDSTGAVGTFGRVQCNITNVSSSSKSATMSFIVQQGNTERTILVLGQNGINFNLAGNPIDFGGSTLNNANLSSLGSVTLTGLSFMSSSAASNAVGLRYAMPTNAETINPYNCTITQAINRGFNTSASQLSTNTEIYTAFIRPSFTETYTFYYTTVGLYHRIWFDGVLVSQNWNTNTTSTQYTISNISCTSGVLIHVYIQILGKNGSTCATTFEWSSASQTRASVQNTTYYIADHMGVNRSSVACANSLNIYNPASVSSIAQTKINVNTSGNLNITPSGGNVGINVASPSYQLELSSDSAAKPSTSAWTVSSDNRLKDNIINADLDICYDNIKSLRLTKYTWKDDIYSEEQVIDRSKLGWIAQEVETIFPKAVEKKNMHGFEDCRTLNADQIYASLYGCVQKLISKCEINEIIISELKNKILSLESIVNNLEIEE